MGVLDDIDDEFFDALGRFTATWAYVEMGADAIGVLIFHSFGGKTLRTNIPYSLDQKIEYLKKAFNTLPDLNRYAPQGKEIVKALTHLRVDRHDYIHGLHGSMTRKNEPVSGRIRYVPDNLFMNTRKVTVEEMAKSTLAAAQTADLLISMILQMADQLKQTSSQEAAGKTNL